MHMLIIFGGALGFLAEMSTGQFRRAIDYYYYYYYSILDSLYTTRSNANRPFDHSFYSF